MACRAIRSFRRWDERSESLYGLRGGAVQMTVDMFEIQAVNELASA